MEILKMTNICLTLCGVLIFQICVNAAPSDLQSKLENIAKVEKAVKPDNEPNILAEEDKYDSNATEQGQRQKRYFNYQGYGFPPINPVIYPNYNRDDFPGAGFGLEDPFSQIYRRLQDIANVVRQPSLPPSLPNHFPIFFPVIYIPQAGCACNPNQYIPPGQNIPTTPPLTGPTKTDNNITNSDVDISNRFPEMEDTNQNWGFVIDDPVEEDDGQEEDYTRPISLEPITPNRTVSSQPPAIYNESSQGGGNLITDNPIKENDGPEDDYTRPISFEPIKPNNTLSRPPPGVNHGTSQAGQNQGPTTTTASGLRPTTFRPAPAPMPASPNPQVVVPTPCDAAVLSCCHQPEVTYDCFAIQGCPDPTSYGNPCEPQVILRVIELFQRFYIQRTG